MGTTPVQLVANLPKMAEGGTTVTVIALFAAVFAVTFEQFVQWHYGPVGIVGLILLTVGIKAKSPTCSSIGAVVLALMMTRPAI